MTFCTDGHVGGDEMLGSFFVKTYLLEISWKCNLVLSPLSVLLLRPSFPCKMYQLARTSTVASPCEINAHCIAFEAHQAAPSTRVAAHTILFFFSRYGKQDDAKAFAPIDLKVGSELGVPGGGKFPECVFGRHRSVQVNILQNLEEVCWDTAIAVHCVNRVCLVLTGRLFANSVFRWYLVDSSLLAGPALTEEGLLQHGRMQRSDDVNKTEHTTLIRSCTVSHSDESLSKYLDGARNHGTALFMISLPKANLFICRQLCEYDSTPQKIFSENIKRRLAVKESTVTDPDRSCYTDSVVSF